MNVVEARPGGDRSRHHLRQFGGCTNRTGLHNGSRYTARVALFPQLENQVSQLPLRSPVDELLSGGVAGRVHPHIEWTGNIETEAARCIFQLRGAEAEVSQQAVRRRKSACGMKGIDFGEIALHQVQSLLVTAQALAGHSQRRSVAVDTQKPSLTRVHDREDFFSVPAGSKRCVDVDSIWANIEEFDC